MIPRARKNSCFQRLKIGQAPLTYWQLQNDNWNIHGLLSKTTEQMLKTTPHLPLKGLYSTTFLETLPTNNLFRFRALSNLINVWLPSSSLSLIPYLGSISMLGRIKYINWPFQQQGPFNYRRQRCIQRRRERNQDARAIEVGFICFPLGASRLVSFLCPRAFLQCEAGHEEQE